MTVKIGYLIPTREHVMSGDHSTSSLIDRARLAADLGFDSLWIGDSLTARPRHDPLTLLAGIATAVPGPQLGTAVLLPALRNPVVLAHQLATIDQLSEGRLIVGAGIAADAPTIRAEFASAGVPFDGRVGRLMEGVRLCRALWQGEPVTWDGRWTLDEQSLAPTPYRPGGPPIWLAAGVDQGIKRAATHFDGWMPIGPDPDTFAQRNQLFRQTAEAQNRKQLTTSLYLTICIMEDESAADLAINDYLEQYYGVPAAAMRSIQACCGGSIETVAEFMNSYISAGAEHLIVRVVGKHSDTLTSIANYRHLLQS